MQDTMLGLPASSSTVRPAMPSISRCAAAVSSVASTVASSRGSRPIKDKDMDMFKSIYKQCTDAVAKAKSTARELRQVLKLAWRWTRHN